MKVIKKLKASISSTGGFVLLFAVLVASIVSAAGLGISHILLKQIILTSMQRDSQVAFFAADAGIECGRYGYLSNDVWPTEPDSIVNINCNNRVIPMTYDAGKGGYFSTEPLKLAWIDNADSNEENESCVNLEIYPLEERIVARGNNSCEQSVRQVERALSFTYANP